MEQTATVAEQEYLEIMFWLEEAGLPMTGANIARAMQLSPPTVHEMVGRLVDDGYVERNADKSLGFTDSGREHASHIVRRHRMIERFLTDVLGIPWDEVHEEAERIEHAMSPVLEERMRAAIGDATTCPHGHPIVEGVRETGSLLADVEVGAKVHVLRFENEAEELLHYLKAAGLEPGLEGTVESSDDDGVDDRLGRRLPRGLAQRRRDRLGPRRPGAAAAGGDPRAAGPLHATATAARAAAPNSLPQGHRDDRVAGRVVAAARGLAGDHHRVDVVHVVDHRGRRSVADWGRRAFSPIRPVCRAAPTPAGPRRRAARGRGGAAACRCRPRGPASRSRPAQLPAVNGRFDATAAAPAADRETGTSRRSTSASTARPTSRAQARASTASSSRARAAGAADPLASDLDLTHDPRRAARPEARPARPPRAAAAAAGRSHSSSARHCLAAGEVLLQRSRFARVERSQ